MEQTSKFRWIGGSLRTKLVLFFLSLSLLPLIVVGLLTFRQAQASLHQEAFNKLIAVRNLKAKQIETYFRQVEQDVRLASKDRRVIEALNHMGSAMELDLRESWDPEGGQSRAQQIRAAFLGKPAKSSDASGDNSVVRAYSSFHSASYSYFDELTRVKGYDDIFLITREGVVAYSYQKRGEFGTNLTEWPYSESVLADVFRHLTEDADLDEVQITDYVAYPPAGDTPISFVATPVKAFYDENPGGILVYALNLDQINGIMQDYTGLGESGETYLVGTDQTTRSTLRFTMQDDLLERVINTSSARQGLAGRDGVEISQNYDGDLVLSAYQPLSIDQVRWVLLAEMSRKEAFRAADRLALVACVAIVAAAALVVGTGFAIACSISNPLVSLSQIAARVVDGEAPQEINVRAHDEIGVLADALRALDEGRRLAQEANQLKSRFLSMVSHELRTPLHLLVGLSEMLLREPVGDRPPLPEPYREDLARIHVGARQLDGLIQDVLDLTQTQVGELKLATVPLNLRDVLHAVDLVGSQIASEKGLEWRIEAPERLPWVRADRTRLQQVMLNLVNNAVKFTARGKVELRIEPGCGDVRVLVSDTGLGVPVEEQDAIFDEFRQSERTITRGYGGLGLGLAICRRLIELHGGTIGVHSSGEEGAGSTFFFVLPTIDGPEIDQCRTATHQETVLLLTQRLDNGAYVRKHLAQEGFEVGVVAVDGTLDFLNQLQARPPGAVILDFEPASDLGWRVMRALKEAPATQQIPVLFYWQLQERGKATMLDLGYLTKPLEPPALERVLAGRGLNREDGRGGQTILVVDDEPGILQMHRRLVQAQLPNCRVLSASNGRSALEMIGRDKPDLVLLDLIMPELDGFGVLRAMQEDSEMRNIPVIVLTAQSLSETDMGRLTQGVATVLSKGVFDPEETLRHIEEALMRTGRLWDESQRAVRRSMAYIHEHYPEPLTQTDLADHVGMSERHLRRCFRKELYITPTAYLNRYRIARAKELLDTQDWTITEVGLAVGFSSASHFSRAFKSQTGVPPSLYQSKEHLQAGLQPTI